MAPLDPQIDEHVEVEMAAAEWLHTEAAAAYDALKADPSRAIPAEVVRARFATSGTPVPDGAG